MSEIKIPFNFLQTSGGTMYGDLFVSSGANILPLVSGINNLGTPSTPFGTIYANFVISSGSTGQFVNISGDTMTGPLNVPVLSGSIISGNTIYQNGIQIINSGIGLGSVSVTKAGETLTISGTQYILPSNVVQSASSSGIGYPVYNSQSGSNLIFNSISGLGTNNVSLFNGTLLVSGTATSLPSNVVTSGIGQGNVNVTQSGSVLTISGTQYVLPSSVSFSTINAGVVSGTIISGNTATIQNLTIDSLSGVLYGTAGLISGSATTTNLPEGTNLYYTATKVSGVIATQAGLANGLATLDGSGLVPSSQMPPIAITDTFVVTTFGDLLSSPVKEVGDVGVVTSGNSYILQTDPYTVSGNWVQLSTGGTITSVNGQAGPTVTLTTTNIAEGTNLYYTDAKARSVISGTSPISVSNALVTIASGSSSQNGYISSYDWTRFDNAVAGSGNYVLKTGDTMTGALNSPVLSGTIISGSTIFENGIQVANAISTFNNLTSSITAGTITVSGSLTPTFTIVNASVLSGTTISGESILHQGNPVIVSGTNLGAGDGIFAQKNGNNLQFKTISGVGAVYITTDANVVTISGTDTGEVNTASNLGNGIGLFDSKSGSDLRFNSVSGVGNVNATLEGNVVIISGTGDGAGDVVGPASATANAIAVYSGTTGKIIKNSSASISDITDNTTNIATVSGVAAQNTIDITTNTGNIANVSGVAFSAVQSGINLGGGIDIFSGKNGTDLQFNTVSGVGNVAITVEGNTIVFSGTGDGNGDVVGPASATDDALAVYDGTTGKLIKNSSASVSDITDNATNIATVSGVSAQNTVDISTNTTNIATVSGVAAQNAIDISTNTTDIVTVSGLTVTNAGNISTNATNIATVSGVAAQNTIDIATNAGNISTVSGVAATAIQSGTSLGTGEPVFSSKNGTNLEFNSVSGLGIIEITTVGNTILFSGSSSSGEANTSSNLGDGIGLAAAKAGVDLPFYSVSGVGNVTATLEGNVVVISGTGDGAGDVVGPASATDNAIAVYDGTTGKLIKNSSASVSDITQNTADIITVSGLTVNNAGNISTNTTNIATVSGVAAQNTIDISTNTINIATVSGVASQNTIDIATNAGDIATVSGVAATAIQSGVSLGGGLDIFSSKNGTDLEFNTVSGVGNVFVTIEGNTVVFSGTGDGNGDVVGPASATDDAIAVYDGTTGKLIKNSSASVSDITDNATNIATVSGVAAQNAIDIAQNTADIVTVSGVASQNTIDISTNATNIATVSGVAATAIQSGISLGGGDPVFASKNGTDLEFNSVSGVGIIEISTVGNTIIFSGSASSGEANTSSNLGGGVGLAAPKVGVNLPFYTVSGLGNVDVSLNGNVVEISGTGDGAGDVVGPASATDDAIAVYDGTTGKLIKNSSATVSDITDNATNIATVSGVAATAIQSGVSLGTGEDVFFSKNGTDLEFNTVEGKGNVTITVEGNNVVISGTGDGNGDVVGPGGATNNAIAVYDGTTGKLIKNSAVTISGNAIYASEISGVNARGFVFAYDTTTQVVALADTFQDVTFDTNAEIDGWTHTPSGTDFVCGVAGTFQLNYSATTNRNGNPSPTIEFRNRKNGTEIAGSQTSINIVSTNVHQIIGTSAIFTSAINDIITLQMAASNTNGEIDPIGANATIAPSVRMTINKL